MGENPAAIEREDGLMRQIDIFKSVTNVADRDMHQWWAEYDEMIDEYKAKLNISSICTDSEMLSKMLSNVKSKVEKVR